MLAVSPKCAVRLFELRRVPPHNLPLAVSPHPDIREAKFSAERLAIFVFACLMVITIRNREVLAVHAHVEVFSGRVGERVVRFDTIRVARVHLLRWAAARRTGRE